MASASSRSPAGLVPHLSSAADCKCTEVAPVRGSDAGDPDSAADRLTPPPLPAPAGLRGPTPKCRLLHRTVLCHQLRRLVDRPRLCRLHVRVFEDPTFNFQACQVTETSSRAPAELDFWSWEKPERCF